MRKAVVTRNFGREALILEAQGEDSRASRAGGKAKSDRLSAGGGRVSGVLEAPGEDSRAGGKARSARLSAGGGRVSGGRR